MQSFDVIVVGGGPAGSTCAGALRRSGMSVMVIDKKAFPRVKPCAGWITPQVVHSLRLDVAEYQQDRTWQPITGFRCGVIGGGDVTVRYDREVSYGIRRYEFDHYLLERSGAELRLDQGVTSLERQQDQWFVNHDYTAPLLVGAGGHFCPVARRLGARHTKASVVYAQEAEYEAEEGASGSVTADAPAIYFCSDLQGYGWAFRKGRFLNVGLGRFAAHELSSHVARFCDFLWDRQIVLGPRPDRWLGHAYQVYQQEAPVLVGDGAVLVGDAAGLAYAQSGEGIRPAIESAFIAAREIVAAAGRYDRASLAPYEAALAARLGKPAERSLAWLPQAWLHWMARRLLAQRWFCRQVVMDQWFLHARQSALEA